MQPSKKFRYYPKKIKYRGLLTPPLEVLKSPVYFHLSNKAFNSEYIEFIELNRYEMVGALKEFLILLTGPSDVWTSLTARQDEYQNKIQPYHMDLFWVPAVPCDCSLN